MGLSHTRYLASAKIVTKTVQLAVGLGPAPHAQMEPLWASRDVSAARMAPTKMEMSASPAPLVAPDATALNSA